MHLLRNYEDYLADEYEIVERLRAAIPAEAHGNIPFMLAALFPTLTAEETLLAPGTAERSRVPYFLNRDDYTMPVAGWYEKAGLLERLKQVMPVRRDLMARQLLTFWETEPRWQDSNATKYLFDQLPLRQQGEVDPHDVLGQALEILRQEPATLVRVRAGYESYFRARFLATELRPWERELAARYAGERQEAAQAHAKKYPSAFNPGGVEEINSLAEPLLTKLGILGEAREAYARRLEQALRLVEPNTDAAIAFTLQRVREKSTPEGQFKQLLVRLVRAAEGGIEPALVRQVTQVLEHTVLRERQQASASTTLYRVRVRLDKQETHTWFVVEHGWGDFDDADEWCKVFADEQDARDVYNYYTAPLSQHLAEVADGGEVTYRADIVTPAGEHKVLPEVVLHQGKVATPVTLGVGRYRRVLYRPYFYGARLNEAQKERLRKSDIEEQARAWHEPELLAAMFEEGTSPEGWVIKLSRWATFKVHNCWETGLNYYQLDSRLPKEVFQALCRQADLFYHDQQIEEEGNWQGWCTTNALAASGVLHELGWASNLTDQ